MIADCLALIAVMLWPVPVILASAWIGNRLGERDARRAKAQA